MAEQNKVEQNNTEGKPQEKKKSKIVLYIVLALLVVAGIVAFFVVKYKKAVDYWQDSERISYDTYGTKGSKLTEYRKTH
jgi:flagellar basal body-associated protein FliL